LLIAVVDKTWHQAYIRPRYRECFGMLIAKLDNIGFAVLSRGPFNNGFPVLTRGARYPLVEQTERRFA
jgi:hypothetical protein